MRIKFDLQRLHQPILVIEPESAEERILLAAFIRYDSNLFSVSIDRFDNGQIVRMRILADQHD